MIQHVRTQSFISKEPRAITASVNEARGLVSLLKGRSTQDNVLFFRTSQQDVGPSTVYLLCSGL